MCMYEKWFFFRVNIPNCFFFNAHGSREAQDAFGAG